MEEGSRSRQPDLGGPNLFFLVVLLRWQELVHVRGWSWGISDNKAAFSSFSLVTWI